VVEITLPITAVILIGGGIALYLYFSQQQ